MTLPIEQTSELATLRQTNTELVAKLATRTSRIIELEAALAESQTTATTAQATLHEIEVTRPMQTLAEAVSVTPELFLLEFSRLGYKVTKTDGKLVLMQNDKPVEGAELTIAGLTKLLANSDDPALKSFKHLMIGNRASGGGATGAGDGRAVYQERPATPETKPTKPHFGLR